MKKELKLDGDVVNAMKIVRCHRLGGFEKNRMKYGAQQRKRPIIIRFSNYHDKSLVWAARNKIGNVKLFMSENFSNETDFNRRKLYPIFKKAKSIEEYKTKVSLNSDVLVINSIRYTVDDLQNLPENLQVRQFSEKTNEKYFVFGGIYSDSCPFSNWFPCDIRYMGHTFKSLEQSYQYAKAVYANDAATTMKLLYTCDPRAAKDLGSKVGGLEVTNWNIDKYDIMAELIKTKFTDHADLRMELLKTGDKVMAESGRDAHYAIGLPITSKDIFCEAKWSGQNKLGKILCTVRDTIRNM